MNERKLGLPVADYVALLREHCRAITEVPPGTYDTDVVMEMRADAAKLSDLADWLTIGDSPTAEDVEAFARGFYPRGDIELEWDRFSELSRQRLRPMIRTALSAVFADRIASAGA